MAPIMFATAVALRAMHARITSTSARSTCCMTAVPTLMAITQTMDLLLVKKLVERKNQLFLTFSYDGSRVCVGVYACARAFVCEFVSVCPLVRPGECVRPCGLVWWVRVSACVRFVCPFVCVWV